jgi:hypothetical protein
VRWLQCISKPRSIQGWYNEDDLGVLANHSVLEITIPGQPAWIFDGSSTQYGRECWLVEKELYEANYAQSTGEHGEADGIEVFREPQQGYEERNNEALRKEGCWNVIRLRMRDSLGAINGDDFSNLEDHMRNLVRENGLRSGAWHFEVDL